MEIKVFAFADGQTVNYPADASIVLDHTYQMAPYKGYTLEDGLDIMEIGREELEEISPEELDNICFQFVDDFSDESEDGGFGKEYKAEMGMSGGPMVAAFANRYYFFSRDGEGWMENDVVVNEDWIYCECITVDPEYILENPQETKATLAFLKNLLVGNNSEYIQPIIDDLKEPFKENFYIMVYKLQYN